MQVMEAGGFDSVTSHGKWDNIVHALEMENKNSSIAAKLKEVYEDKLLGFEKAELK